MCLILLLWICFLPTKKEFLPYLQSFKGIRDQNEEIISRIKELMKRNNYELKDFAILSSSNKPLKFLEEAFERYNLGNYHYKLLYRSFMDNNNSGTKINIYSNI